MSFNLQFPDAETMRIRLNSPNVFNLERYQSGLTKGVIDLALKRFPNTKTTKEGIELESFLILKDLRNGEDFFTGERLPKFDVITVKITIELRKKIEQALLSCMIVKY